MKYFGVVVVGSRFLNIESRSLLGHKHFVLRPEPDNQYDKNAVQVLVRRGDGTLQVCGHVSRHSQKELPQLPEQGREYRTRSIHMESPNAVYVHFEADEEELASDEGRGRWLTNDYTGARYYCECPVDYEHCECEHEQTYDPDGLESHFSYKIS